MSMHWALVTGEYPPQPGGVADYTALVARGLVAAGDAVTVFAPPAAAPEVEPHGVRVRRLADHFGPRSLAVLDRELHRRPGRVLLQYTPHAFGWKAMNVPLCAWLWARRPPLDVMFHEVAFPFEPGQPWRHRLLATVQRGMAALLLRAAARVFVSIPGWEPLLHRLAARAPRPVWAPVPSNVADDCPAAQAALVRDRLLAADGRHLVGHFGTYGPPITRLLRPALVQLLARAPGVRVLLLGRGGTDFAAALAQDHPELAGRLVATGPLDARAVGAHIAACDVLVQPFPDGVSARRTSLMSSLALGQPVVTTAGHLTEPFWCATGAVAVAALDTLADATLALLADAPGRAELGARAAALYRARFAVEHTIRLMRAPVSPAARSDPQR
jgi:glycosyltransferase involved in cell wall biosynthesis